MNIDDLSATELAKLDAICLQYETDLRQNRAPTVDSIVEHVGGENSEILRVELNAIRDEIQQPVAAPAIRTPFQIPSLQQPSTHASSVNNAHDSTYESLTLHQPLLARTEAATSEAAAFIRPSSNAIELPKAGDRIGPYVVGTPIARGGMGAVFRATDTRLDREVAIKVLSIGAEKKQELNDRFEREAKAVAALSHPNIVELFDVGVVKDSPFAVMELLRGETLADRLDHGRMSAYEVRNVGAQIADALAVAHQAGVIHRDLKPQNIMILGKRKAISNETAGSTADGQSTLTPSRFELATSGLGSPLHDEVRVKVFDFGLSRVSLPTEIENSSDTQAGAIMGTPGYMAPEQVRGEPATAAADIFALGCVLYRSFYGEEPIRGATTAERFAATLAPPPEPDAVIVGEDRGLADLIRRCLSQDIADRPESAAEITNQLRENVQTIDPTMARLNAGQSSGEMFRRRFLTSIGGGLVGALAGSLLVPDGISELQQIKSLAVLSFDADSSFADDQVQPIGIRKLTPGDKLSALLVNELSQLSDVAVPPYRALTASSPEEFRQLASELHVDAFVTGSVTPQRIGSKDYLDVDLRIVSANGQQLWGHAGREEVGDNLLQQSQFATDIANKINRRLTATLQQSPPPPRLLYKCLIDGKVRSDPDSVQGMQMALGCLEKAEKVDPTYVQPIAGTALVSMTLAAQSDAVETKKLVAGAIDATKRGYELEKYSVDLRLANAMIQWQIFADFDEAESELKSLAMLHPYHWQIQHQYGLLLLAIGQQAEAARILNDAARLNALSMLVKSDTARAAWFGGNSQRAINDAKRMIAQYPTNKPAQAFARGLLIDIYEHQNDFRKAAATDPGFGQTQGLTKDAYFARRAKRLKELPYGPFGEVLNRALLNLRVNRDVSEETLVELVESSAPMLPLLLAVHPAFVPLRQFDRASEWLA